jgi:hypothetical protein
MIFFNKYLVRIGGRVEYIGEDMNHVFILYLDPIPIDSIRAIIKTQASFFFFYPPRSQTNTRVLLFILCVVFTDCYLLRAVTVFALYLRLYVKT